MTPKHWISATNAIGIVSKTGRYGGTFAHIDIAFEFSSWMNAEFKFYLIKEFQCAIKKARQEKNLTQEKLGSLVGVQKAQISKIENSFTNARFDTILKVFDALGARITFNPNFAVD